LADRKLSLKDLPWVGPAFVQPCSYGMFQPSRSMRTGGANISWNQICPDSSLLRSSWPGRMVEVDRSKSRQRQPESLGSPGSRTCQHCRLQDADQATLPDIYDLRSRCFRRQSREGQAALVPSLIANAWNI
jgi:hypothetical protein